MRAQRFRDTRQALKYKERKILMKLGKLKTMSAVAIASALLMIRTGTATAATLTVGNATSLPCTGTFPTIQSAITLANPGDTIQVCQGTYNEQVQVTKTLTLQGA